MLLQSILLEVNYYRVYYTNGSIIIYKVVFVVDQARGVYEGSYWELIRDCEELIEMLQG